MVYKADSCWEGDINDLLEQINNKRGKIISIIKTDTSQEENYNIAKILITWEEQE